MAGTHSRKQYWVVFAVLAVLTVLEIAIAVIPGMRTFVIIGLIGLALAKAGCVLLWYMHLITESKILKQSVIIPFFFPTLYAVVLVTEAVARGRVALFD